VSRSTQAANSNVRIGHAIACSFDDGNQSDQAKARLRRLLACKDTEEACHILRPLLRLIQSRVTQPLDYVALLEDLRWFHADTVCRKARWAQQF